MQIIDVLQKYIEDKGISVAQVAKEAEIVQDKIYKWLKKRGAPKTEDYLKLVKWLKDNFVEIPKEDIIERYGQAVQEVYEQKADYITQRRNQKNNKPDHYMVPLMPVKAQAGYVRAMDQSAYIENLERYALPPGVDPTGAIWRYWEVEGDSMIPVFNSGDIILTSQVPRIDWEQLRNFYLYVIVTVERVIFKRIYCKNELEWVLISENEDLYQQQALAAEDVKEVWVYRRSIVNKAPPSKTFKITV